MKMSLLMSAGVALLLCSPAIAMDNGSMNPKQTTAGPTKGKTSEIPYYVSPDGLGPTKGKTSEIPHYSAAGQVPPTTSKTSAIPQYGRW